jgi:hypothetical protein
MHKVKVLEIDAVEGRMGHANDSCKEDNIRKVEHRGKKKKPHC